MSAGQRSLQPTYLRTLPRALLVARWKVLAAPEEVLRELRNPAFDPERLVLLEGDPGLVRPESEVRGSVSVHDVSTEVIEIRADVPEPAILVITDNYSASWRAVALPDSSAQAYEVVPANYTLRAIPLRAGRHHLRLEYRPVAFTVGTWVTLLSLALYAAAVCRLLRRGRPRTGSSVGLLSGSSTG